MITFKEYYIQEKMTKNEKLIALGLASAAAIPGTAYLGQQAGEALADKPPTPIVQAAQPPTQPPPAVTVQPAIPPPVAAPAAPAVPEAPAAIPTALENIEIISGDLRGDEGVRLRAYDDHRNNRTIGIGHRMTGWNDRRERAVFTDLEYDETGYNNLYNRRTTLADNAQAEELFTVDITQYGIERARRVFGPRGVDIDFLGVELQTVFTDLAFRGDLNRTVRGHITDHDWAGLSATLTARGAGGTNRGTGVQTRLNENARIITERIEELDAEVARQQNNR